MLKVNPTYLHCRGLQAGGGGLPGYYGDGRAGGAAPAGAGEQREAVRGVRPQLRHHGGPPRPSVDLLAVQPQDERRHPPGRQGRAGPGGVEAVGGEVVHGGGAHRGRGGVQGGGVGGRTGDAAPRGARRDGVAEDTEDGVKTAFYEFIAGFSSCY